MYADVRYLDAKLVQPEWMLHPMQEFIRADDAVRYEELQAFSVAPEDGMEYVLFYVEGDREPYEAELQAVASIRWYDITPVDDGSFYCYVCQETRPEDVQWRQAFAERGLVLHLPIVYDSDAAFYITVVGESDDLQTMLDDLPDDIDVTVNAIGEYDRRYAPVAGGLSDRQFEAVETAVGQGFYEYPREASVADVAAELGCAESTATVLLQRAEAAVMERLVTRHGRHDID